MNGPTQSPQALAASRIVLTGFMGAGKTTVGSLLGRRLGWKFVDSDRVIESRAGSAIADIFALRGEAAFRDLEASAVRDCLEERQIVLALGGGALETASTQELLSTLPECLVVFLEAPLETMIARCCAEPGASVRPVLADRQRLAGRWESRLPLYRRAHLTVQTQGIEPDAVADRIAGYLRQASSDPERADTPFRATDQHRGVPA